MMIIIADQILLYRKIHVLLLLLFFFFFFVMLYSSFVMNTLEKILEPPLPLPPFSEVLGTISKP
jgi:hypothetical protein